MVKRILEVQLTWAQDPDWSIWQISEASQLKAFIFVPIQMAVSKFVWDILTPMANSRIANFSPT